jgi:hypothetical protein
MSECVCYPPFGLEGTAPEWHCPYCGTVFVPRWRIDILGERSLTWARKIHPDLGRAQVTDDWQALAAIALRAREAVDDGRYCECDPPELSGTALMCGACLLRNKNQERAAVDRMVRAHDFVPGALGGLMCEVCSNNKEAPRHHGVPAVGTCSWGESRQPA